MTRTSITRRLWIVVATLGCMALLFPADRYRVDHGKLNAALAGLPFRAGAVDSQEAAEIIVVMKYSVPDAKTEMDELIHGVRTGAVGRVVSVEGRECFYQPSGYLGRPALIFRWKNCVIHIVHPAAAGGDPMRALLDFAPGIFSLVEDRSIFPFDYRPWIEQVWKSRFRERVRPVERGWRNATDGMRKP